MGAYAVAKGAMAQVWATGTCPVCSDEMSHVGDEVEDGDNEDDPKLHLDTYSCTYCNILVTYISPAEYGMYYQVPASERCYFIERSM